MMNIKDVGDRLLWYWTFSFNLHICKSTSFTFFLSLHVDQWSVLDTIYFQNQNFIITFLLFYEGLSKLKKKKGTSEIILRSGIKRKIHSKM